MCDVKQLNKLCFCMSHKYLKGTKSYANKQDFEIKLNWTCQRQHPPPPPLNNMDLNQGIMHIWSKFGGPSLNRWWVIVRTSPKWSKFWLCSYIWPWGSRTITPQNNRNLNQGILHLWFKYGDPSLNGTRVIARTSKWLTHRLTHAHTHTDTHTDAGDDNTQGPKLASGKNESKITRFSLNVVPVGAK